MPDARHFPIVALLLGAPALSTAQESKFTSACSESERELLEEAHAILHGALDLVWREIDEDRAGANVHGYEEVSDSLRTRVASELETLRFDCDGGPCDRGAYGYTGFFATFLGPISPGNRVLICMDNIRAVTEDSGLGSDLPLVAAAIGHEVVHMADGFGGHPDDEDITDPETALLTVGVAIDHLLLTPDLRVEITSLRQTYSGVGGGVTLEVGVKVENANPFSAGGTGTSISGWLPNGGWGFTVRYGDVELSQDVRAFEPGEVFDGVWWRIHETVGYDPTAANVEVSVEVDSAYEYRELDESNNADSVVFSPEMDLAITSFELAEPYEVVVLEGGGRYYHVRWNVAVTNLSERHESGLSILEWTAPIHLNGLRFGSSTTQLEVYPLAPGQEREFQVEASIPALGLGELERRVRLTLDPERAWLDPDRSNNVVELVLDENWFAPDYTVVIDELDVLEGRDTLIGGRVRNIGPEPGGPTVLRFLNWDGSGYVHLVPALGVLEEAPFQFLAELEDAIAVLVPGQDYELRLSVDPRNTLDENDETNNQAYAKFRYGVDLVRLLDAAVEVAITPGVLYPVDLGLYDMLEGAMEWPPGELRAGPWTRWDASGPFLPSPEQVFVGVTPLGVTTLVVDQWIRNDVRFRVWRSLNAAAFESRRAAIKLDASRQRRLR